jgi:hypothetical protein
VVPRRLEDGLSRRGRAEAEERFRGPVGQPDPAARIDDDEPLDHAVEQGGRPLGLLPELGVAADRCSATSRLFLSSSSLRSTALPGQA